ncbi:hypothetical protein C1H46_015502 [Malus baccata]|uniref:Uncharacterized protein n=1 Tax=Malus baccata TaxID=106549 RepID=A0A540MKC8_MALBA|nr:hypothetical protein C1H46_015502 [Malus baccata]
MARVFAPPPSSSGVGKLVCFIPGVLIGWIDERIVMVAFENSADGGDCKALGFSCFVFVCIGFQNLVLDLFVTLLGLCLEYYFQFSKKKQQNEV